MTPGGTWAPRLNPAYGVYSIEASDRAERTMENLLTSSLMLSAGVSDLCSDELGPFVDRYFSAGQPAPRNIDACSLSPQTWS